MIVLEMCEDAELAAGGEHLCNDSLVSLFNPWSVLVNLT